MMNKLCDWTKTDTGSLICSITATIGGLHLLLTAPQPVLNFLPAFSFSVMGREVGAQQVVGAVLTLCGVCALGVCCMPNKIMVVE
tara:strand:+ start:995 stop:1249 length:255 start_codon:yes stop_codon:yes gene_type:complete